MENNNLIEPIQFIRFDNCQYCHRNTIELFSYDNYSMHYGDAVIDYMRNGKTNQFNRFPIYRMKCRGCGRIYNIIWRDGFPIPLQEEPENRSINIFLSLYNEDFIASKKSNNKNNIRNIL